MTVSIDEDSVTTNLVIVLDTSGSMIFEQYGGVITVDGEETTKLALEQNAAKELIEEYSKFGPVNVKIVQFDADSSSSVWINDDIEAAKTYIDNIDTNGGSTNYESALDETMDTYGTAPVSDQSLFYFMSDGDPTAGDADNNIAQWKTFAEDTANFDDVFTIAMGTNVDVNGNDRGSLADISNVGDVDTTGHITVEVNDFSTLSQDLIATINTTVTVSTTSGNNTLDFDFGADGAADGGAIDNMDGSKIDDGKLAFTWGTPTLTDSSNNTVSNISWSVSANGLTLLGVESGTNNVIVEVVANLNTKTYDVTQIAYDLDISTLNIPFTVTDGDGDSVSSNVNITVDNQVDTAPTLSVEARVTNVISIDDTNVESVNNGYKVSAFNPDGSESTISKVSGTSHDGFGVTGSSSGAETEIGYDSSIGSEVLKVEFENEISSITVDFAWKHSNDNNQGINPGETALIRFFNNGVQVGDDVIQYDPNHTDTVDEGYLLTASNNEAFDEVQFLAHGEGDDYLIHNLEYTEAVTSDSEIRTQDDTTFDFSITTNATGSVIVSGLLEGMTISDKLNPSNTFTADSTTTQVDVKDWNLENIEITVPSGISANDYDLNVVASNGTATSETSFTFAITNDYVTSNGTLEIDSNEDIDLGNIITNNVNKVDLSGNGIQNLDIDLSDVVDLTNENNELYINGDDEDKVDLDIVQWDNTGKEEVDGVDYNVYKGIGANSTVKLLIEDDVDII